MAVLRRQTRPAAIRSPSLTSATAPRSAPSLDPRDATFGSVGHIRARVCPRLVSPVRSARVQAGSAGLSAQLVSIRVLSAALAIARRTTPGSSFEHSNFGCVIVGAAIERATGRSWEAELKAQVFEPLGMKSCGFGPIATGDARDQRWAHVDMKDEFVPVELDNPPFLGPAGTVHCSLADWGSFAAVFFDGASFVSADSIDRLPSPV